MRCGWAFWFAICVLVAWLLFFGYRLGTGYMDSLFYR